MKMFEIHATPWEEFQVYKIEGQRLETSSLRRFPGVHEDVWWFWEKVQGFFSGCFTEGLSSPQRFPRVSLQVSAACPAGVFFQWQKSRCSRETGKVPPVHEGCHVALLRVSEVHGAAEVDWQVTGAAEEITWSGLFFTPGQTPWKSQHWSNIFIRRLIQKYWLLYYHRILNGVIFKKFEFELTSVNIFFRLLSDCLWFDNQTTRLLIR